jgi:hypothetical protein
MHFRRFLTVLLLIASSALWIASPASSESGFTKSEFVFVRVDINAIGPVKLAEIKKKIVHRLSIEADMELIILTTKAEAAKHSGVAVPLDIEPKEDQLFVIKKAHEDTLETIEGDVIAKAGRSAVVQAKSHYLKHLTWHPAIAKLEDSIVLAKQWANSDRQVTTTFTQDTSSIVESVSGIRWQQTVNHLASMNRFSRGADIQNAQRYLEQTLSSLPAIQVTTQPFTMGATTGYNVIGKLTGTTRPDDWIIIGAHYDSISQSTSSSAPGAEDNASGTAGMLELARIFAETRPEATILFIGFSGEEQGLKGSYAHVAKLIADGNKGKVKAVLTMDMIGYTNDADLDCLLESDRLGSALFPILSAAAQQYTNLRIVTTLNPFGSDHVPYIEEGIPSLLVIENDWNSYPQYHKTSDTPDQITLAMGEQTLRMQAAAVAQLAGASFIRK